MLFPLAKKQIWLADLAFALAEADLARADLLFALAEKPNNLLFGTDAFWLFCFCTPPKPILEPIGTPPMSQKAEFGFLAHWWGTNWL